MITHIPIPELRSKIDSYYRTAGKADSTRKQLDHVLRLAEQSGVTTTGGLTTDAIARMILARGDNLNPNTTRGILARMRTACSIAVKAKALDRDDQPDWKLLRPRARAAAICPHTPAEIGAFLEYLRGLRDDWFGRRTCALGWLVAMTGLRRNEALTTRVEHLDLDRGFVFVLPNSGSLKTEASASPVPLPRDLIAVLADWVPQCRGSWLFPSSRSEEPWLSGGAGYRPLDRLRKAGDAAGIIDLGFHSLRHSLATNLLQAGTPIWVIQRILRHTTPVTTQHYLHPSDVETRRYVADLSYSAPSKIPA